MKKSKLKNKNGITLIALIITIIIMLILVAVSINIIIKSDLFGAAQNAADKTQTAYEKEGKLSEITIGGKTYSSIEEYIAKSEADEELHSWKYVDDATDGKRSKVQCQCEQCKKQSGTDEGLILEIGQQLKYEKLGKGTTETEAKEENGVKVAALKEEAGIMLAAGDGNADTTGISISTKISAEKSGVAAAKEAGDSWADSYGDYQTVTITEAPTWVVFGIEDQNGNGNYETLLLTTETPTTGEITLYGAAAYNACGEGDENEIDRMCKELYGEEARGMKIEDVNRAMGYDKTPNGANITYGERIFTYEIVKNEDGSNKKFADLGDTWTAIKVNTDEDGKLYTPKHPNGVVVAEDESIVTELGEYEVNGYVYARSSNEINAPVIDSNISTNAKNLVFGSDSNYAYWLASRGVYANADCAVFGPGAVLDGGAGSGYYYFDSYGYSDYGSLALRAVVSLTSNIPAVVTPSESVPS